MCFEYSIKYPSVKLDVYWSDSAAGIQGIVVVQNGKELESASCSHINNNSPMSYKDLESVKRGKFL
jgi:hypothetical protein